jgi:hypothetical protein
MATRELHPCLTFLFVRLGREFRITEVQTFLGRIKLHAGAARGEREFVHNNGPRTALGPGAYLELELRAPSIGWHGTADLVVLSDAGCEIVDFKTGSPDETHRFHCVRAALEPR